MKAIWIHIYKFENIIGLKGAIPLPVIYSYVEIKLIYIVSWADVLFVTIILFEQQACGNSLSVYSKWFANCDTYFII